MAATKTRRSRSIPGDQTTQSLNLTCDNAYPPGGYQLLPSDFGLQVLRRISSPFFTTIAGGAYELVIVPTLNADGVTLASVNVALVVGTSGAQVANGVDVSAVSIHLVGEGN